jgi:hypothetical protein
MKVHLEGRHIDHSLCGGPFIIEGHGRFLVEWWVEPEDVLVRGNAIASDDPDFDRMVEDEIIARLDSGNGWAWCVLCVRVTLGPAHGMATLGCCSASSKEDFLAGHSDYFDGLIDDAKRECVEDFKRLKATVDSLASEVT